MTASRAASGHPIRRVLERAVRKRGRIVPFARGPVVDERDREP